MMRRKSTRNASKVEKVKTTESPTRKTRRSRRRRKSTSESSDSEDDISLDKVAQKLSESTEQVPVECKSHTPSDEEVSEQPVWTVTTSNKTEGEIQKLKLCLTRPASHSPDKLRKRRNKSTSQNEDDSGVEAVNNKRSSSRTSEDSPYCQEDEKSTEDDEIKGKGKSKAKNKSKIEKHPNLIESEVKTQSEISANVQVTDQSPTIDIPVDNENVSTVVENIACGKTDSDSNVKKDDVNEPEQEDTHQVINEPQNCIQNTEEININVDKDEIVKVVEETKLDVIDLIVVDTKKSTENINETVQEVCEEIKITESNENNVELEINTTEEVNKISDTVEESSVENTEDHSKEIKDSESNEVESSNENLKMNLETQCENVKSDEQEQQNDNVNSDEQEQQNDNVKSDEQEQQKDNVKSDEQEKQKENVKSDEQQKDIVKSDEQEQQNDLSSKSLESHVSDSENSTMEVVELRDDQIQMNIDESQPDLLVHTQKEIEEDNDHSLPGINEEETQESIDKSNFKRTKSTEKIQNWGKCSLFDKIISSLLVINTDTIKIFCPDIELLQENEIKLDSVPPKERRRLLSTEHSEKKLERKVSIEAKQSVTESSENSPERNDLEQEDKSNIIALNRKISIVDDTAGKLKSPPSPAKNPTSEILFITNLVRPFTLKQLKELLERTGKIRENGFWTDRIKSKCYVQYETPEEAEATRNALHGVFWPIGNGKKLIIDYATEEEMENARNPPPPPPPVVPEIKPIEKENQEPPNKITEEEKPSVRDKDREIRRHEGPVREWDIGKEDFHQDRSRSKDRSKRRHSRHSSSPVDDFISRKQRKMEEAIPQKLMDDLFQKTKTMPSIYWQPLSPEEISTKQQQRLLRMAEHKRRMEENTRSRGGGDFGRGGLYRRRYD